MSKLRLSITMSLDGYVAGPDQSEENPLGKGGMELHEWFFPLKAFREMHGEEGGETNASSAVVEERRANIGATIMGRNMFGPVRGRGQMSLGVAGGARTRPTTIRCSCSRTTRASHSRWRAAPPSTSSPTGSSRRSRRPGMPLGDGISWLAGGASVVNQYLKARLVDEIDVSIAPVILGAGARLFDGLERGRLTLKQIRAVDAPGVTHIKYEVS